MYFKRRSYNVFRRKPVEKFSVKTYLWGKIGVRNKVYNTAIYTIQM